MTNDIKKQHDKCHQNMIRAPDLIPAAGFLDNHKNNQGGKEKQPGL